MNKLQGVKQRIKYCEAQMDNIQPNLNDDRSSVSAMIQWQVAEQLLVKRNRLAQELHQQTEIAGTRESARDALGTGGK